MNATATLLTTSQAAALLGVTVNTLRCFLRTGRILQTPETRGKGKPNQFDPADVLRLKDEKAAWHQAHHANQPIVDGCKKCTKCGLSRPVERFNPCARTRCGLASWCKDCIAVSGAAWHQKKQSEKASAIKGVVQSTSRGVGRAKETLRRPQPRPLPCLRETLV